MVLRDWGQGEKKKKGKITRTPLARSAACLERLIEIMASVTQERQESHTTLERICFTLPALACVFVFEWHPNKRVPLYLACRNLSQHTCDSAWSLTSPATFYCWGL